MAASIVNLRTTGLALKTLPIPPDELVRVLVSTPDGMPGYFEGEFLDFVTIPRGWDIHFDIIQEMKEQECWEDVTSAVQKAMILQDAGADFAECWNHMTEECIGAYVSYDGQLELKLKSGSVVTEWNEKIARLRRELEKQHDIFLGELADGKLKERVMLCFEAHRNLGVVGDGGKWWVETVELLLRFCRGWFEVAFTFEMWLEDVAQSVEQEAEIREVQVVADVLCASFEYGQGMRSRQELVYLLRDGKMSKKGKLAWVSVELGHVTGRCE